MKKFKLVFILLLMFGLFITIACTKEEKTYTVSFETGTQEVIKSQTIKENEKAVKPTDPKKDGADFLGWYIDGSEYDFNKGVTSNLTLTAKWDAYFTITFITGTDTAIADQKIKTDGKVEKPADPVREGYLFAGWYIEETQYDFDTVVTKDLELTAKWEKEILEKTIGEIIAAEVGAYKTEGVVVGVNNQSFLLKDASGTILVYLGTEYANDLVAGDKVKVTGETSVYGFAKQFGKGTEYEKVGTETVSHGSAKELSISKINEYATAESVTPIYVRIVGKLEASGKYFNLNIEGANITGSLTYPADSEALNALNGETIEVYGYITGVTGTSTKYLNILFTEVNKVLVESINVSFESANLNIGDELQITVSVFPEEAKQDIEWVITPADCATISEDNVLKALKGGSITVRANATDGSGTYREFLINIYNDVEEFTITGSNEMYSGKTQELKVNILTSNTNSEFEWISSDETIATVDQTGLVTAIADGVVTITVKALDSSEVSETFEITITTIDISFKIGETKYATIEEAIEAADEGDTILLPIGELPGDITINKSNIILAGQNAGINGAIDTRKPETVLKNVITIGAGVSRITIDGLEFTGDGQVLLEDGVSEITVQYCVMNSTTKDGIVRGPAEGEVTDIKVNYNYAASNYKSNRFAHFNATINGLELIGNNINATTAYDLLNVSGMLKGKVVIANNIYTNSLQSFIYVKGVGVADIDIYGNTIEKMANTIIDIRDMKEDGDVVIDIYQNEFNNNIVGWMPIRIRTSGYDANDTVVVNINDNKFIDSYDSATGTYIENPSYSTTNTTFNKIYVIGKNYFIKNGNVITSLTAADFNDAAVSFEQPYASEDEVPGFDD